LVLQVILRGYVIRTSKQDCPFLFFFVKIKIREDT